MKTFRPKLLFATLIYSLAVVVPRSHAVSCAKHPSHPSCQEVESANPIEPQNPKIVRFSKAIMHPDIRDFGKKDLPEVREVMEQTFAFPLLTPDFCADLVEELRAIQDGWLARNEAQEQFPLKDIRGMGKLYAQLAEKHLRAVIEERWITFRIQKFEGPVFVRSIPDGESELHSDSETVTLIVHLNNDFVGGGWAVFYPGGVSHEYELLPVTDGEQYQLIATFL